MKKVSKLQEKRKMKNKNSPLTLINEIKTYAQDNHIYWLRANLRGNLVDSSKLILGQSWFFPINSVIASFWDQSARHLRNLCFIELSPLWELQPVSGPNMQLSGLTEVAVEIRDIVSGVSPVIMLDFFWSSTALVLEEGKQVVRLI